LYGPQNDLLEFFDHFLRLHACVFEVLELHAALLDVGEHF
jgi:hypothetical protein